MKTLHLLIILLGSLTLNGQGIKYNGVYESEADTANNSSYFRFYADGVALSVATEANSKDIIKSWFNYENRKSRNLTAGFFIPEQNNITIVVYQGLDNQLFLEKGSIKSNGSYLEIKAYWYSNGMVHEGTPRKYFFKPL